MTEHRIVIDNGEPYLIGRDFTLGEPFEYQLQDDGTTIFRTDEGKQ